MWRKRKKPQQRAAAPNWSVRLYVVSDFHASAVAWRKMLNAVRLDVYGVDAILYAGDLTGKGMVPILERRDGWEARFLGSRRRARSEDELLRLERDIARFGYYALRTTEAETDELLGDRAGLEALFIAKIREQVAGWLDLAADRLEHSGVPLIIIPGNDDPYEIDDLLTASPYAQNIDRRVVDLPGNLQVAGLGLSSPTPWHTPREVDDTAFGDEITNLLDEARHPSRTILLTHCPPYDSGIDRAPQLSDDLTPVTSGTGEPIMVPVGSVGVRRAIEQFQPLVGVHGHIHESPGEHRIGDTVCLNPGSEAALGIVQGCLLDIDDEGVRRVVRVEG